MSTRRSLEAASRHLRPADLVTLAHATAKAAEAPADALHIAERLDPASDFDPDDWLTRLKAAGGGVWFSMEPSLPEDRAHFPAWLEVAEEVTRGPDAPSKRSAIFRAMVLREAAKIAAGTDTIGDREADA